MSGENLEFAKRLHYRHLERRFHLSEHGSVCFTHPNMAKKPGGRQHETKKDIYRLLLNNELIQRVAKARYFTKLDIRQGFHRIRMDPESEELTSFESRY